MPSPLQCPPLRYVQVHSPDTPFFTFPAPFFYSFCRPHGTTAKHQTESVVHALFKTVDEDEPMRDSASLGTPPRKTSEKQRSIRFSKLLWAMESLRFNNGGVVPLAFTSAGSADDIDDEDDDEVERLQQEMASIAARVAEAKKKSKEVDLGGNQERGRLGRCR